MAQLLLPSSRWLARGAVARPGGSRAGADPAAAARGILIALALSCLVWIALAVLVPRLW